MPRHRDDAPAPLIWLQPAPPRPRELSRERIVRAAVAVADDGGTTALTMAAVAGHLGSYSAMALYRYVSSKDGLIDLMLDHVIAEVQLPLRPGRSWRADIERIAGSTWEMAMRHGWYPQLVYARPPLGPNMMRRTETLLGIFIRHGASTAAEAMSYATLIDRHILGSALQAVEERAMDQRYGLTTADEVAAAITAVHQLAAQSGDYPILSSWMAAPHITSPTEQFQLSLGFLLDGIAARLRRRGGGATHRR
jgi:AcrR family transcriptional regulator